MKITESKLRNLIMECFVEVIAEARFRNNNPRYTHYLVNKATSKIVNGWDYKGKNSAEVKYWSGIDIEDMGFNLKEYGVYTKQFLVSKGINPDDNNAWANS